MNTHIRQLQTGLRGLGHDPGPIDGIRGRRTERAVLALAQAWGLTLPPPAPEPAPLPWMVEARRHLGRHETRDNAALRAFLSSNGAFLGDPAKLPWCGDFTESVIKATLPGEPFPGALGQNPFWARNWSLFGVPTEPTEGAVAVFSRGSGGHVGFVVGRGPGVLYILGGNQSDAVTIAPLSIARLLATRWPSTFPARPIHLPAMTGGTLSTDEA